MSTHDRPIHELEERIQHFEGSGTEPSLGELSALFRQLKRATQRFVTENSENRPQTQVKGADEKYISEQFKNGMGGRRTRRHKKRSGHKRGKSNKKRMSRRR